MIEEAIAQIGDHGESFDMPEMLRAKGDILARLGNDAGAESYLQKSLALSRRQGALGWQLRAAISLGRIWQRTGRTSEARGLLAPLVAQYHEGLSTSDPISAQRILESLN